MDLYEVSQSFTEMTRKLQGVYLYIIVVLEIHVNLFISLHT